MRRYVEVVLGWTAVLGAVACGSGGSSGLSAFVPSPANGLPVVAAPPGAANPGGTAGTGSSLGSGSGSAAGSSAPGGSGSGSSTGSGTQPGAASGTDGGPGGDEAGSVGDDAGLTGAGIPPFGGSSGGTSGAAPVQGSTANAGGVTYYLIVPSSYAAWTPNPLLLVFSGTEGGAVMTQNLLNLSQTGIGGFVCVVLDGVDYYGDGAAGATALDDVRSKYDIDNDRTYLLGESAGTTAALQLGFHLRQSYFAAYWANDVNASDAPAQTSAQLGFQPWGQAGPGGDLPDADAIVTAMQSAGYRLPNPAPYAGPGSTMHGNLNQLVAALSSFSGQSRQ